MGQRFSSSEVKPSLDAEDSPAAPEEEAPFRIVVLGDFSGRSSQNQTEAILTSRHPVMIDRDDFDEVLARMGVKVSLPIDGEPTLSLRFSELDDFHPDRLFDRAAIFGRLREARLRVLDPVTFAAAAEELGVKSEPPSAAKTGEPAPSAGAAPSSLMHVRPGSLLDEIVENLDGSRERRPSRAPDALQDFARRVVAPHLVAASDPRQAELIGMIDRALSALMRALLHAPTFQAMEAAWRAMFFLARRVETGPQLKLYLIDISKEELAGDLMSLRDLRATAAYRLLVDETVGTAGAEPWALIVGNYTFGPAREDAELLSRLARIANAARAPFVAAASPHLVGCSSVSDTPRPQDWRLTIAGDAASAWAALRRLPEASAIGLALPRFLLRLPYGKKTDEIETFDFEEMPKDSAHEDYLWGGPGFACAALLAESFSEYGWEMRPGVHAQIDGLPLHVYQQDGESDAKPCGEALLTDEAAERVLEGGLMPLVSLKGQDAVRLPRFQSIASPPSALFGRWRG